jgi:hypothetical protein
MLGDSGMTASRALEVIAIIAIVGVAEKHFGYSIWEEVITGLCVGFLL